MGRWFDIPWVEGQNIMDRGIKYHGLGEQNTMGIWVNIACVGVDIPWVVGPKYHGYGVDIQWVGDRYTMDTGQNTSGMGSIYHA